MRINQVQDSPDLSADNWDIVNLSVTLLNPVNPNPGSSGIGMSTQSAWHFHARGRKHGPSKVEQKSR
jgi:hypothetical protein